MAKKNFTFPPARAPAAVVTRTDAIPEATVLTAGLAIPENRHLQLKRKELIDELGVTTARIHSQIHFRLAFSLGTIWLVILGASLAMILRGGHILVALLLGFIPSVLQLILLLTGKALAMQPGRLELGIGLMWASDVVLVMLDVVVIRWFLRR